MAVTRYIQQFLVLLVCFTMTLTAFAAASPANAPSVFANRSAESVNTQIPVPPAPSSLPLKPVKNTLAVLNPVPPVLNVHGYYLQDVYSGKVLASQNPDEKMAPASLTKLMTLYIIFEALQAGRIHMTDLAPVSENAWHTGGSRMFIKVGDRVPVSDLINGIIIDSGNDACVAMAEFVGGTEDSFVNLMNEQAALLGMKNTHYMDCTGLPDASHYTTPADLAILARAIILNFPQYYPLFKQKTFTFNHITQPNRNRLLWRDPSVDGLKTGHTEDAGFCLVSSAERNSMRLLAVLLGAPTDAARAQYSQNLLNYGFRFFETHKVYGAQNAIDEVPVYMGKSNKLPVGVTNDFYLTVPAGQYQNVVIQMHLNTPFKAPVLKGQKVGSFTATFSGKLIGGDDLVALTTIEKGGIFSRLADKIKLAVSKE